MIEAATIGLPTAITISVALVLWAFSVAGFYYTLRGRMDAAAQRMDNFSRRFDEVFGKIAKTEEIHADHSARLVKVETVLSSINDKLDNILVELKSK